MAPIFPADPQEHVTLRKLTASFDSRAEAKKAVLELRQAGYTARQIRILRGVPMSALEKEAVGELISRYVRHLVGNGRVTIRVVAPDIENAAFILRNLGAEVAVNQFFRQSSVRSKLPHVSMPIRRWCE